MLRGKDALSRASYRRRSGSFMRKLRRAALFAVVGDSESESPRIKVSLLWSVLDPDVVVLEFPTHARAFRWPIARDLLVEGLHGPAAGGGVAVLPDSHDSRRRELIFTSGETQVGFRIYAEDVTALLRQITIPDPREPETYAPGSDLAQPRRPP